MRQYTCCLRLSATIYNYNWNLFCKNLNKWKWCHNNVFKNLIWKGCDRLITLIQNKKCTVNWAHVSACLFIIAMFYVKFPQSLKTAKITLTHKCWSIKYFDYYRPISSLPFSTKKLNYNIIIIKFLKNVNLFLLTRTNQLGNDQKLILY